MNSNKMNMDKNDVNMYKNEHEKKWILIKMNSNKECKDK